jgi:hypothetical protein
MVHFIIPAPVPVMHAQVPTMDPRNHLASMARALNRDIRTSVSFDARSRTYGCRISEPRRTSNGQVVMYTVTEIFGQPDSDTAERHAASTAVHVLSAEATTNMAIPHYSNVYR